MKEKPLFLHEIFPKHFSRNYQYLFSVRYEKHLTINHSRLIVLNSNNNLIGYIQIAWTLREILILNLLCIGWMLDLEVIQHYFPHLIT